MKQNVFIITDYAMNNKFPNEEFNSFNEGWEYIEENIPEIDHKNYLVVTTVTKKES